MDTEISFDVSICFVDHYIGHGFDTDLGLMFSTCIYIYCDDDDSTGCHHRIHHIGDYIR